MDVTVGRYGMGGRVELSYAQAIEAVKAALAVEGFGVLSEIDVQATLKAKIGQDVEPYIILGACNPALASEGLGAEPDLGLWMPCNVVVYEREGAVWVKAIDPAAFFPIVANPSLDGLAEDVRARLARAMAAIGA